jgi:hypothetical protein
VVEDRQRTAILSHHANSEGVKRRGDLHRTFRVVLLRLESAQLSQSGPSKVLFSRVDPNFSRHRGICNGMGRNIVWLLSYLYNMLEKIIDMHLASGCDGTRRAGRGPESGG